MRNHIISFLIILFISCSVNKNEKQADEIPRLKIFSFSIPTNVPLANALPPIYDSLDNYEFSSMLYEGLFTYHKPEGKAKKNLVLDYKTDSLFQHYTFTLKQGVLFANDQQPLKSKDVVNTIEAYIDTYSKSNKSSPLLELLKIDENDSTAWYEILNNQRFKINLNYSFENLPLLLSHPDLWVFRVANSESGEKYLGTGFYELSTNNQSFTSKTKQNNSYDNLIIKPIFYSNSENELNDFKNGILELLKHPPLNISEDWYETHLENKGLTSSKYSLVSRPNKYLYFLKFSSKLSENQKLKIGNDIILKLDEEISLFNVYGINSEIDSLYQIIQWFKSRNTDNGPLIKHSKSNSSDLKLNYLLSDQYSNHIAQIINENDDLGIQIKSLSPEVLKSQSQNGKFDLLIDRIDLDFVNHYDLNSIFIEKRIENYTRKTQTLIKAIPLFLVDENTYLQPYVKNFSDKFLQYRNLSVVYLDTIETLEEQ